MLVNSVTPQQRIQLEPSRWMANNQEGLVWVELLSEMAQHDRIAVPGEPYQNRFSHHQLGHRCRAHLEQDKGLATTRTGGIQSAVKICIEPLMGQLWMRYWMNWLVID